MGFKRFDYEDPFFFAEYGYQPFVLEMNLAKGFKMEIDSDRDGARLYKANKRPYSENYFIYMELSTRKDIQFTLAVFGRPEKAMKLNQFKKDECHA